MNRNPPHRTATYRYPNRNPLTYFASRVCVDGLRRLRFFAGPLRLQS